jgi:hypothetical protein
MVKYTFSAGGLQERPTRPFFCLGLVYTSLYVWLAVCSGFYVLKVVALWKTDSLHLVRPMRQGGWLFCV